MMLLSKIFSLYFVVFFVALSELKKCVGVTRQRLIYIVKTGMDQLEKISSTEWKQGEDFRALSHTSSRDEISKLLEEILSS